jgi:hypothetical protein
MAVPTAYLTTVKNIKGILEAIQKAAVPERFTYEFLKQLGFGSSGDRPTIPVLKAIGFLAEGGQPTDRYRRFKDPASAGVAMAEGLREAYTDLFAIDPKAYEKSSTELKGVFGRLSDKGDAVNKKMATTFKALAELGDFVTPVGSTPELQKSASEEAGSASNAVVEEPAPPAGQELSGLVSLRHDVHIHLPVSSDIAVYNAIFKALKETLR